MPFKLLMGNSMAMKPSSTELINIDGELLTSLFKGREEAEQAYQFAVENGCKEKEISVFLLEKTRDKYFLNGKNSIKIDNNKTMRGKGLEGARSTAIGLFAIAVMTVGTTLLLPGIGGLVVIGPLAADLTTPGITHNTSSLEEALRRWGIAREKIANYTSGLITGGILIGAKIHPYSSYILVKNYWTAISKMS
ncbi:hypothetical protein [Candidatus Trichorickettsia mobilis]|uniref:hypothetical protein n=1 Tax=Candidatus Trichorickettsia mobilis TaxID=1346319 RepID=UPI00292CCD57|nr:hypothetical protein [Candidatus Trichorickettsia mobilis]